MRYFVNEEIIMPQKIAGVGWLSKTFSKFYLRSDKDKDIIRNVMPNLIYASREKGRTSPHHFKVGALNV